jgi:hypothetical protein
VGLVLVIALVLTPRRPSDSHVPTQLPEAPETDEPAAASDEAVGTGEADERA